MSADDVLATLRETRDTLVRPDGPRRVDLRHYITPGSEAWMAFVNAHGGIPGRRVKRSTMLEWLDSVIAEISGVAPEPTEAVTTPEEVVETPSVESAEPVTPPSETPPAEAAAPADEASEQPVEPSESAKPPVEETVAPLDPLPASVPPADTPSAGTPLRALNAEGIERARAFLEGLREHPEGDRAPPHELLYSNRYSCPFPLDVRVEPRAFHTRREAGEYLSSVLKPVERTVIDNAGVWSGLGMYYFSDMAPENLSPNNMTIIFESGEHTSNAGRSELQRYRNYLWASWRLFEQHGDSAAFLPDQDITSWDDLSQRSFGSRLVFSSVGVVQLILLLYTEGDRKKKGYSLDRGGMRHLLRTLPQLELTYDVYGMDPDALLEILPEPFHTWTAQ